MIKYLKGPSIPLQQRGDINKGVVNLLGSGSAPNKERVYQAFTGKGGLHGLDYSQFDSRYDYTQAKQAFEGGQFFTPHDLASFIVSLLDIRPGDRVSDLTCGAGAFFNHLPDGVKISGCELDPDAGLVARYLYPDAEISIEDLRLYESPCVDFIVGNPPFGLRWRFFDCPLGNGAEVASEDFYLWKVSKALAAGGITAFVVPSGWLDDELIHAKARQFVEAHFVLVAEIFLPTNLFSSLGATCVETKIIILRTKLIDETRGDGGDIIRIDGRKLDFSAMRALWASKSVDFQEWMKSSRSKRVLLNYQQAKNISSTKAVDRYAFEKVYYHLKKSLPKVAEEMFSRWGKAHESKPSNLSYEEWVQIKEDPIKVIRDARKALRNQHRRSQDLIRLTVSKGNIVLKTYSHRASMVLSGKTRNWDRQEFAYQPTCEDLPGIESAVEFYNQKSKNPVVLDLKTNAFKYARRVLKKTSFLRKPLKEMKSKVHERFANQFYSKFVKYGILPNPLQIKRLVPSLLKPFSLLAWEQGCGKTLASLCWAEYKQTLRRGATVIVTSPLSIRMNWEPSLQKLGINYELIESIGTLPSKPGIYLLTHSKLIQLKRKLSHLIKMGVISSVIVDESDEFASRDSQRGRALFSLAKARYKLTLTGTPARNNAGDLWNQLAFLFHGDPSFRCEAEVTVKWSPYVGDGEWVEDTNYDFGKIYRPFKDASLFMQCHSPSKPTVLGVNRSIADLPNREALVSILDSVRWRLTLKELMGREPFQCQTHAVKMAGADRSAYTYAMEHARALVQEQMKKGRKASLLSIAQAIRYLQQTCSNPSKVPGFSSVDYSKQKKILDLVLKSTESHIAIGCIWKDSIDLTVDHLKNTGRHIFHFDGEESFVKRDRILKAFQNTPNSVLVTTQQSMRSSLNVPWVTEVIAESLPWNFASLGQWAHRFIRYDSQKLVQVHLLVCRNTLEERILGLLLRKEEITRFAAGDPELKDLGFHYGIDQSELSILLDYLMGEKDESLKVENTLSFK